MVLQSPRGSDCGKGGWRSVGNDITATFLVLTSVRLSLAIKVFLIPGDDANASMVGCPLESVTHTSERSSPEPLFIPLMALKSDVRSRPGNLTNK